MSASLLDPGQIIKHVYDPSNEAIQVNVVASSPAAASSVKITDGAGGGEQATVTAALALKVDGSAVTQPVSAASLPLPAGAATSANQSTEITALGTINTTLGSPMQSSGGSIVNISGTISLPTGAATNAELITINSTLGSPMQETGGSVTVLQPTGTNLHTVVDSGTIAASQSGTWNITNVSGTVSLPTGASTSALQTTGNASLASLDSKTVHVDTGAVVVSSSALPTGAATSALQSAGNTTLTTINSTLGSPMQNSGGTVIATQATGTNLHVVVDSAPSTVVTGTLAVTQSTSPWIEKQVGFALTQFVRNDYTSVNVTTGAYVQLIASTSNAYQEVEIFDSSGQTMKLAFGAPASEVDQILIFPGGNGRTKLQVPASTRVSIRAVSANASVGEVDINLYG